MNDLEQGLLNFFGIAAIFSFLLVVGFAFGREYQCKSMGAEYENGKCVIVTKTVLNP